MRNRWSKIGLKSLHKPQNLKTVHPSMSQCCRQHYRVMLCEKMKQGAILRIRRVLASTLIAGIGKKTWKEIAMKRRGWQEGTLRSRGKGRGKKESMFDCNLAVGQNSHVANCCCLLCFRAFLLHLALSIFPLSAFPGSPALIWAPILFRYWQMHPSTVKPSWSSHQSDPQELTERRMERWGRR